ncbi:hypothetical protein Nepgr_031774 [Nepenthes gracilis]|uniref:ABC1 atypical kinase-like domain-containing protein n=1 Tax=Nepenthes gracilis TaxID=150966 RepID=A0AAD3TJ48_NEPGR|nr:hypothetical protein Nepgr_031774 [Nepenthes gracilis]
MKDVLRIEKGEGFISFDEQSIAAASIPQVHHAVLKNHEEVAVKVQYPGLEQLMKLDITTMSFLSKAVAWDFPTPTSSAPAQSSSSIPQQCGQNLDRHRPVINGTMESTGQKFTILHLTAHCKPEEQHNYLLDTVSRHLNSVLLLLNGQFDVFGMPARCCCTASELSDGAVHLVLFRLMAVSCCRQSLQQEALHQTTTTFAVKQQIINPPNTSENRVHPELDSAITAALQVIRHCLPVFTTKQKRAWHLQHLQYEQYNPTQPSIPTIQNSNAPGTEQQNHSISSPWTGVSAANQ